MAIESDVGDAALPSSKEFALATLQQWQLRKKLRRIYPEAGFSLATIMAALISLLGILTLIAVILRQ